VIEAPAAGRAFLTVEIHIFSFHLSDGYYSPSSVSIISQIPTVIVDEIETNFNYYVNKQRFLAVFYFNSKKPPAWGGFCVSINLILGLRRNQSLPCVKGGARSAGGIVLNKLQFFKNAGYFELSLQQPLSHGFAVTAPLTQWSLEAVL
jgi:hypothetical protein